jgi:hypothetical protein
MGIFHYSIGGKTEKPIPNAAEFYDLRDLFLLILSRL